MEEAGKHFGKSILYGIASICAVVLVIATLHSGGILHEAVINFMGSIC